MSSYAAGHTVPGSFAADWPSHPRRAVRSAAVRRPNHRRTSVGDRFVPCDDGIQRVAPRGLGEIAASATVLAIAETSAGLCARHHHRPYRGPATRDLQGRQRRRRPTFRRPLHAFGSPAPAPRRLGSTALAPLCYTVWACPRQLGSVRSRRRQNRDPARVGWINRRASGTVATALRDHMLLGPQRPSAFWNPPRPPPGRDVTRPPQRKTLVVVHPPRPIA